MQFTSNCFKNIEMTTKPGRRRHLLKGPLPNMIRYHIIIISLIQFLVTFAQGQGPGTLNDQGLSESYHFYIDENVPIAKRVGKISVDPGTTVQISSRASSPDHVYFELDSHTGVLRTAKALDRENLVSPSRPINIVILTVPPSLPIEMKITVNDVNDNHPKFPKSSYAVSFKEESDAKNKQTIPKAIDSDEGKNSLITNYSIVSGNEDAKFALIQEPPFPSIPRILYLQNIVKLNREETEYYQLNISATDHGNPSLNGFMTVNITVADINDNYPTFHMSVYEANVNETAPPGTTVIKVEASDLDRGRNRDITYSMENNRDADQFEIHPYTGVVTTTKKLNCRQTGDEKSCFITLLATDNGPEHLTGRAYLNIHIIDQNDHAPVIKFQHLPESTKDYSAVNENAKNGTFVTIITVNDQDDGLNGKVSVTIIDGNQLGHFKLNTLHSVSVLEVVDNLDREKVHVYNLTIKAVDMGSPPLSSTAHLVIYVNDINDHPPQFDQAKYFAVLSEVTPVGSFVTAVKAKDSDFGMNSQITYKIVKGNGLGWFHINSQTGLVTTVSPLDYEVSPVIILNISAQDGGFQPYKEYTTLNVTLHDINDMAPTFRKKLSEITLDEGLPAGTKITQLQAEDNDRGLNGTLRYALHSDVNELYPNCFLLSNTSGYLTTAKQLDREENAMYTIRVLAYDIGISPLTSTATVRLTLRDINDNRPVFYPSKYYPKIYANHEENQNIMRVTATDRDAGKNGEVTYQLTGGDVSNFRIDRDSGLVSVVGRLDPSVQAHYRLTISGQDGGGKTTQNTATAMITVLTTSDEVPYFLGPPYSFSVTEDKEDGIGRVIGHVRVKIKDPTANITLSIIDGDPNGDFSIDPYRGNIRTAKMIDRETKSSYTLRILASSEGLYAEEDVHIKVLDRNDNRPKFETGIVDVNLMENWAIGKEVYQASAVDLDAGINARITYSLRVNSSHPFMITHSGMIYLSQPLDKSPKKIYELTVIAVDSGTPQLSSSQKVRLHVKDVNDHTPVFASIKNSISLKESRPINDRFFLLSATDADEGKNKEITYSIIRGSEDGKFAIFPDGNLYIASELDRETKDFYHLTVVAEDQGIPSRSSSANITIQILDANDNPPVFSNQSYTMYIKENEVPGKYIGTVHATDADIGRNSELFYYLNGEEDNFAIDSRNGQITSRKSFDREELMKTGREYYTFEVLVKDNGIQPLQSKTKVKVIIKDDNDNAPSFTKTVYKASVSENAAVNTSVAKVSATDADTNENQFVTYAIIGGNEGQTFSINSATGLIILMSTLDREKLDHYKLSILAYDAGKDVQLKSSAEVWITVLDSNDNTPTFHSPPMSIELLETVIPGSLVSQFHASDGDLGNNALLTFSIVDGNINDTFHVDGKSGKIYLMQRLDYEVQKVYHLNISVSDYGVPQLVAYQRFIVYVHDDNDNSPTFPENPVTFTIDEGTPISTVIGTVQAEDPDTGINGEVRYRIASQSPPGIHFRIVNSGDILVNREVDREETRYFSLIVVATDNANPTSAQRSSEKTVKIVIRDVNDNAPKIVSPDTFVIPADSLVGTEVGRVEAIDLDSGENGRISYTLISGDTSSFQMSSSSGVLTLRANLPAGKPILTLNIRVSDAGFADRHGRKATTTKVTVIASSTDLSRGPSFSKTLYTQTLSENVHIGTDVLKVQARPENRDAVLEYYITRVSTNRKENPNGALMTKYFSLDKDSGQLTTTDSLDRDLGFTIISIEICALEKLDSTNVAVAKTKANVELRDVNDSPPHFSQNVYALEITEDHPLDRTVLTIPVNDPDTTGSVQLSIRSGNNRTFTISDSGILTLRRFLDREVVPRYTLQLEAFDGLHTATAMVQINILDINDNVPIFNKTIYTFDLPEDLPVNSTIGSILAQDKDEGVNGTVSYHLLSDWGKNVFSLDSRTGTFKLKSPLDFEQVQLYTLLVSAMDQGPLPCSSTVTVYMNVKDVNDNGPIFSPSTYTTAVSENVTIGTSILTVFASDADTGPNSNLFYEITGGNKMGHFKINKNTGSIFTNHSLDREKRPFYKLTASATDTGTPLWRRHSATTKIMVIVNDVNDCAPRFTTSPDIWVDENAPIGAIVYNITAIDADDIGPNQDVTYSILSDFEPFSISPNNGSLKMLSILDREQQDTYQLIIKAQDKGVPPKSSILQVTVHVRDQNDNDPVFHPKQYQANISESTSVGTILLQVTATDADIGVNGMIRYFIIEGDDNQDLSMDQSSGILRVQKNLDYERKKSYHVIVQCEDGGAKPRYDTAAVYISIVDVNDNAPVFVDSPYLAYVQENMAKFPVHVVQLSARDDDSYAFSRISYAIRDGNRNIFNINSTTGEVYAKQKLDRERENNYRLTVIATDSGSPPLTGTGTVNIEVQDVNDNTPTFLQTQYTGYIKENQPINSPVLTVKAEDKDERINAFIRYSLIGNLEDKFTVDPAHGTILTTAVLDREQKDRYNFEVVAQDAGYTSRRTSVPVSIIVKDRNDNKPQFNQKSYNKTIYSPTRKGQFVFGVSAIDLDIGPNGKLIYSLSGPDKGKFLINSSTGVVKANQNLYRSTGNKFTVYVTASDQNQNPFSSRVPVTVNMVQKDTNNIPVFQPLTEFVLNENSKINMTVTTVVAHSPQGSTVRYNIAGGNVNDAFRIDHYRGIVSIANPLDFEDTQDYALWIEATDTSSDPLSAYKKLNIIIVDVNDNAPHFEQIFYNTSIYETNVMGTSVTHVLAKDDDSGNNGKIRYRITNGNTKDAFEIDRKGLITTKNKIDREEIDYYHLIVEAVDQGGSNQQTGTTTVDIHILDVDDNAPRFTRLFTASIPENAEVGSFVLQLSTKDPDIGKNAAVTYELLKNPSNKFALDPTSGNITVNEPLDLETQQYYRLPVAAKASSYNTRTDVTIEVTDVNDNAPVFSLPAFLFEVSELQVPPVKVGTIMASDNDKTSPSNQLYYSLKMPSKLFNITDKTGIIYAIQQLHYDNSSLYNHHELVVQAVDLGVPSRSSEVLVTIQVIDANDNPPRFEKRFYFSAVPYNVTIGDKILQVVARDEKDYGMNARVEYVVVAGNGTNYFHINKANGTIHVTNSLSQSMDKEFELKVQAIDKGQPPQSSDVATVHLKITDINRYAPGFRRIVFDKEISEGLPVGSIFDTVQAEDHDYGPNSEISYYITGGDPDHLFAIHERHGNLSVNKPLDYEKTKTHRINITARDHGLFYKETSVIFTIIVTDINDNPPVFEKDEFDVNIPENSPIGTSIFKLNATDADSGSYGYIEYRIVGDVLAKTKFLLDSRTLTINTSSRLDFELKQTYSLHLLAKNPGSYLQNTAVVNVHLTSVNEFYPVFLKNEYNFSISESVKKGTTVGSVLATDLDSGVDGVVYYFLMGSSNLRGFKINALTGAITVSGRPDYELHPRLTLDVMAKNWGSVKGGDTDQCRVHITVTDANDPPVFTKTVYNESVSEGVSTGTPVIQIAAHDNDLRRKDHQFTYTILAGNIGNAFQVDSVSGQLYTRSKLDRETVAIYNLTVGAADKGTPPQTGMATVRLYISDVNDCAPAFTSKPLVAYVTENLSPGFNVISLSEYTIDCDLPPNRGPYSFHPTPGPFSNYVQIDTNGLVTTKVLLDREEIAKFPVVVTVMDNGVPAMTSSLTFSIIVRDINDMPSKPRTVTIFLYLFQGKVPSEYIANVQPLDEDASGDYSCKILQSSAEDNVFSIPHTCHLQILSFPNSDLQQLLISGQDGIHNAVTYNTTVHVSSLTNETLENSVTIKLYDMEENNFVRTKYEKFINHLETESDFMWKVNIFGLKQVQGNLLVFLMALDQNNEIVPKEILLQKLQNLKVSLQSILSVNNLVLDFSSCILNPCQNGGTCTSQLTINGKWQIVDTDYVIVSSPNITDYICKCAVGYGGTNCDIQETRCGEVYCHNGGTCTAKHNGDSFCMCLDGWTGPSCTDDINECDRHPCQQGTCHNVPGSFTCTCKKGFSGRYCETGVDHCKLNSCKGGSTCVNDLDGFTCQCPYDKWGKFCSKITYSFEELSFLEFPTIAENVNNITVYVATKMANALLLYNPAQPAIGRPMENFVALEIVEGMVHFSILTQRTPILQLHVPYKVNDGSWYKVQVLRIHREVRISVNKCYPSGDCSTCIDNNKTCSSEGQLQYESLRLYGGHLYLGGIPNIEVIQANQVRSHDFIGCMRSFIVNGVDMIRLQPLASRTVSQKCVRKNDKGPCSSNPCQNGGTCQDKWSTFHCICPDNFMGVQCEKKWKPFSFVGGARLEFTRRETYHRNNVLGEKSGSRQKRSFQNSQNSVSIRFRTQKDSGLLWYASSENKFSMLVIKGQQPVFVAGKKSDRQETTITLPLNVSNGFWYTLEVLFEGDSVTIEGNNAKRQESITDPLFLSDPNVEILFLANTKFSLSIDGENIPGFDGCLENFKLDGNKLPFGGFTERFDVKVVGNASSSCPSVCATNPCSGDMICEELTNGYRCVPSSALTSSSKLIIMIVVPLLIILIVVLVIVWILIWRHRKNKWGKKKSVLGSLCKQTRNNGTMKNGSHGVVGPNYSEAEYEDCHALPDEIIIRNHILGELAQKAHENSCMPKPDIIESESHPVIPLEMEDGTVIIENGDHSQGNHMNENVPEHYDLENASSIAPSDIDIVTHYKGFRDGKVNKYKPGSNIPPHRQRNSPYMMNQDHCSSPWSSNSPASNMLNYNGPLSVPARSSPMHLSNLARNSPAPPGAPPAPMTLATRQSPGLMVQNSNTHWGQHSASAENCTGKPGKSKTKAPKPQPAPRGSAAANLKGLTVDEVNRLNARPVSTNPESMLDVVTSSEDNPHLRGRLNKPNTCSILDAQDTSSNESANDSFTCSEYEYDNERARSDFEPGAMIYSKLTEVENENDDEESPVDNRTFEYDGLDSAGESYSTLVSSDEDKSKNRGTVGSFDLDYLLTWGPNFEKLVGVFKDIALLPDSEYSPKTQEEVVTNVTAKSDEEYV